MDKKQKEEVEQVFDMRYEMTEKLSYEIRDIRRSMNIGYAMTE